MNGSTAWFHAARKELVLSSPKAGDFLVRVAGAVERRADDPPFEFRPEGPDHVYVGVGTYGRRFRLERVAAAERTPAEGWRQLEPHQVPGLLFRSKRAGKPSLLSMVVATARAARELGAIAHQVDNVLRRWR